MNGLTLQIQAILGRDPYASDLFVFRRRRGNLIKVLWHGGLGTSLYAKRLERSRFIWPSPAGGVAAVSSAQLLDHCCYAWNRLIEQPWVVMSIGLRKWAHQ